MALSWLQYLPAVTTVFLKREQWLARELSRLQIAKPFISSGMTIGFGVIKNWLFIFSTVGPAYISTIIQPTSRTLT